MKRKTIFFTMILFLLVPTVLAGIQTAEKQKDKEKIKLQQAGSGSLHSVPAIKVEAYQNGSVIELFVENYTGLVEVFIQQSSICKIVGIDETGYISIDISQLPERKTYILRIVIDHKVYEGIFER